MKIDFTLNGEKKVFETSPMERLLDVIRNSAGLTGTKEGCGEGECGACSVFVNGELVNSCLIPVAQMQGARIETVESLAKTPLGRDVQEAFRCHGGAQCGICTPGMLMAAVQLVREKPKAKEADIREALAGNLCRCTGYRKIFDSVAKACVAQTRQAETSP